MALKFRPSLRIERNDGETVKALIDRVIADSRSCLGQRESLLQERDTMNGFDECCLAIWMEQAPIEIQ